MAFPQILHELLRDADDSLPLGYGPDLCQSFSIQREALNHVLALSVFQSVGELPPCVSLPRNVSRMGRPSVENLPEFSRTLGRCSVWRDARQGAGTRIF